jgi:hypothetical protein
MYPPSQQQWQRNFITNSYTHITTGVQISQEMVLGYGFPPANLQTELEIRTWYFNQAFSLGDTLNNRTAAAMNVQLTANQMRMMYYSWEHLDENLGEPIELLLCVASCTDHIPASVTYTVSLEWLRCRTSKDLDWLSCSLVKSPQHIKLWEKDFILTQIIPPGSGPIREVICGCRLKTLASSPLEEVFQVRLVDSEDEGALFFVTSEMR